MSQVPPPSMGHPGSQYAPQPQRRTNGAAIASLVFGILGCIPFITGLLAVVLGIVGVRKASSPQVGGKGLAIAGIILGVLSIGIWSAFGGTIFAVFRGTAAERDTVKQFINHLAAGDAEAAMAQTDGSIPRADLDAHIAAVKSWGALTDVTSASFNYQSGVCEIAGVATFGGMARPFVIELVERGEDQWKVHTLPFGIGDQTAPQGQDSTQDAAPDGAQDATEDSQDESTQEEATDQK
jgi:hypothetical protein